ncbi:uncharacterized protein K444DRAFT_627439 [Hyaloscypha bicolor E]|uniref:Uncharacterized protein n=1 Tax=Hyaloscypha bicolor E TaxID=1095630 RepID=A0A2J6THM3_9HELO|nr:uncharacterized protein K444DRAFT_627439 [Hyaloscypha bicolor E]PMD62513.1 hypothetical protein K444DRAFT_627439 [Hyaloscypha bicolor E]
MRASDLTVEYAKLRSEFRSGTLPNDEYVTASKELDLKLEALDLDMPQAWHYSTTLVEYKSDRVFDLRLIPIRIETCYARDFLWVGGVLLNETLIDGYLGSPEGEKYKALMGVAHDYIDTLAGEICASAPQYTDCDGLARQRLPSFENSELRDHGSR